MNVSSFQYVYWIVGKIPSTALNIHSAVWTLLRIKNRNNTPEFATHVGSVSELASVEGYIQVRSKSESLFRNFFGHLPKNLLYAFIDVSFKLLERVTSKVFRIPDILWARTYGDGTA